MEHSASAIASLEETQVQKHKQKNLLAPATFNQIQEGQLYFNSTTNTFKETITDMPGGTWASGGKY